MRFTAFSPKKTIKNINGRYVSSQIYLKKRTGMAPELMGMKEACVCVFICIITAAHDRPMHQQAATRIVKKKATLFIVVLAQQNIAIALADIAVFACLPTMGLKAIKLSNYF
jgi:hypothetical protein